ncbi:MAG: hypothetical protein ACT4NY_20295 [Pseudonocardiales bacterium]
MISIFLKRRRSGDVNNGMKPAAAVQIHFPREQIQELSSTLSGLMASADWKKIDQDSQPFGAEL